MSRFIKSYVKSRIMDHKVSVTVEHQNQTLRVTATGTVSGSRLDPQTEYENLRILWDNKNVTKLIEGCEGYMEKIYAKLDESLHDLHFAGEFASVEEYENMYQ